MNGTKRDLLLAALLVGIGVLGRWVDHAPNATPLAAIALFAGYAIPRRWLALLVPLGAMLLSDALFAGGYDPRVMAVVYGTLALNALVGRWLVGRWHAVRVLGGAVAASLLFFLTTNFAVWSSSLGYAPTWAGIVHCYANGLPFLVNTLRGDLAWSGVLFGGAALLGWLAGAVPSRTVDCQPAATH